MLGVLSVVEWGGGWRGRGMAMTLLPGLLTRQDYYMCACKLTCVHTQTSIPVTIK